ncbi:MAG: RIP metalloprotease RseP [Desulfobacterales bacterium]|nr:RIP metalloprotease RseP [Desulfobacterales bacterium]
MFTTIFSFIVVLGILIFFHELGHFLVARLFGVGVEKFSLGFGPRLFGKKIGRTDYIISAMPLGGYVKMVGEEPNADISPVDMPVSFTHKHVFKRILIVAAGPFFNFLLAVIIFFGIFQSYGTFVLKTTVGDVTEGSPAYRAGLEKGDEIIEIDGFAVESWEMMAGIITESKGKSLAVTVRREGSILVFNVIPKQISTKSIFGDEINRYVIGIKSSGDMFARELNPFQAFSESIIQTWKISKLVVISIGKMIQGTISIKTMGGPIMIAEMAGQQAREGATSFVFFIALLSINLGILNILPIPVLDGGHLIFFFIEVVTGRPVGIRIREIAQQAGVLILILLMIFVFYNDISRIFFS